MEALGNRHRRRRSRSQKHATLIQIPSNHGEDSEEEDERPKKRRYIIQEAHVTRSGDVDVTQSVVLSDAPLATGTDKELRTDASKAADSATSADQPVLDHANDHANDNNDDNNDNHDLHAQLAVLTDPI